MGGALAIPIMQLLGLLMGIAEPVIGRRRPVGSTHPTSSPTPVGPRSREIAGPRLAGMAGIVIGRIDFAKARIVGRA